MTAPADEQAVDEQECGYVYDHDEEVTHEDETGVYWICRRCGAEGFPDDDEWTEPSTRPGKEAGQ